MEGQQRQNTQFIFLLCPIDNMGTRFESVDPTASGMGLMQAGSLRSTCDSVQGPQANDENGFLMSGGKCSLLGARGTSRFDIPRTASYAASAVQSPAATVAASWRTRLKTSPAFPS
jgi:hypothetical protein